MYPCKFGEKCPTKSSCRFVHPGESQAKTKTQDRHRGTSPQRNMLVTASNTTALPGGINRWGKPPSNGGGVRNSFASKNNASSAWSGQSITNRPSSNGLSSEATTTFGNFSWESGKSTTDSNNTSTFKDSGWGTGESNSNWANESVTPGWTATGSWDTGGWDTGGWETGGNLDARELEKGKSGSNTDGGSWSSLTADTPKVSDEANFNYRAPRNSKGQDRSSTSTFGSWRREENKDTGEGEVTSDIQMREPSSPSKQFEPNPKSPQPISTSSSKFLPESPAQTPLSPSYVPPLSAISAKFSPELKTFALEVSRPQAVPMKIKGIKGRRSLYERIIKQMRNAVISYIEYQEARADLGRWKDTQNSTIYGHATQKTRKILDSERTTFHRRLADVEDTFQQEINALINLPESLVTDKKGRSNVLTKEVVSQYTQELQDWFKDLELHRRLLVGKEEEEEELEDGEIEDQEEGKINDSGEEDIGQKLSELLRSGQRTWKVLTEGIEALENCFDSAQTNFYFEIFTCVEDDSKARLRLASENLELLEDQETHESELPIVSEKLSTTGKSLEKQSEMLAKLLSEAAELEKEITAVRQQTVEANSVCQLADRLFGDFEQWQKDDEAQLAAVTEQIKLLHLHNPNTSTTSGSRNTSVVTAPAPSSRSTIQSIPTSDLIDPIRQRVIDTIRKELELCFDNLHFQCMQNQQKLEMEMEEEAKKIVNKAEIVKQRTSPSRVSPVLRSPN